MSVEKLDQILAHEIEVQHRQRIYMSGFLIAIGIVVASLVTL